MRFRIVYFAGEDQGSKRQVWGGGKDLYPAGRSERIAASAHHAALARLDDDWLFLESMRPDGTFLLDRAVIPRSEGTWKGP